MKLLIAMRGELKLEDVMIFAQDRLRNVWVKGIPRNLEGSCKLYWKENIHSLVTFSSVCYTNEINSLDCFCQLVGMMLRGKTRWKSVCRSYLEVLFLCQPRIAWK
jgi:hypothetical protein